MESLKRLVHLVNKGSRGQIHIFVGKVMRLWYIHSYSWASLDFTIGMQRQHQPLGSCQLPSCCSLRIVLSLLNAETSLAPNSVSVLVWLGLAPLQRVHGTVLSHTLLEANFGFHVHCSFALLSFCFGMKSLSDWTFLEKYKLLYKTREL